MATAVTTVETIPAIRPMETMHMRLQPNIGPGKGQSSNANGSVAARQKNRLRLDPARALEPARKKIATIEAQRVMTVFDETIKRTEIITLLPFILENVQRFSVAFGTDLMEALDQHRIILSSYNDIRGQLDKIRRRREKSSDSLKSGTSIDAAEEDEEGDESEAHVSESRPESQYSHHSLSMTDSQTDAVMRNLSIVAQQLSHSTKALLRAFSQNPAAINAVRAETAERSDICQSLVTAMEELKEILMFKLLTTPVEEKEKFDYLHEIAQRERQNAAQISKLETELKSAMDDRDDETKKKKVPTATLR